MKKNLSIIFIILIFLLFFIFQINSRSYVKVLKVLKANEILVDLNSNGVFDSGETLCIDEDVFTSNLFYNQDELAKKYKINNVDAIKIGYLTDNFADNILSDRKVKVKFKGENNQNCKFADIYVDKESYQDKLYSYGYSVNSPQFKNRIENAKNLDLVILNHKSNKYHKLDCNYGLVAHDTVIIPKKYLLKDAVPCKYCHIDKKKQTFSQTSYPSVISNGNIKMYLTDLTVKLKPDNGCSSLVCSEILSKINSAEKSIDMAVYGWDNVPEIYEAFKNAKKRGVKIRVVYDNSKNLYYPDTAQLLILADEKSGDDIKSLMHNKFVVIDKKFVITGSMNFSKTGLSGFNSNVIFFINSLEIANIYEEEFSQMLKGKFHSVKSTLKHSNIDINGTKLSVFFSPKDRIVTRNIIPMIEQAQSYIYIPAFIITHDELSNTLIKAKQRGVDVKIIVDASTLHSSRSKVKFLREAGIPVKVENYAGKVHSKSIIIDDKYIIAGSMNFTNSGENKNDENSLIIEDARLAKYYKEFFVYLWNKIPDKYLKQNPPAEGKASIGSCSDGIDNDYDGKIDMEDEACKGE